MRISNDGYINNTNKRLIQLKNNEKVSGNEKSKETSNKVDLIKAGIRENSASMRLIQTEITRDQIALEHLNSLNEKAGQFKNSDFSEQDLEKLNQVVQHAADNALFKGENVFKLLNVDLEQINNKQDFDKLIKSLEVNIAKVETSIENNKIELSKNSLREENKLAVLSADNNLSVKDNVKSIVQNIGKIFNAQSNIMNEQVKALINR